MDYCRYVWRFVYYFPRKWQKCQKKKKTLHIWGKWERIPGPSFCLDPHQKLTGFCSGPRSKFCGKYAQCFFVGFFLCVCVCVTKTPTTNSDKPPKTNKQTNKPTDMADNITSLAEVTNTFIYFHYLRSCSAILTELDEGAGMVPRYSAPNYWRRLFYISERQQTRVCDSQTPDTDR